MGYLIEYQLRDVLILLEQHLHSIFVAHTGGILLQFSSPILCDSDQYRMPPSNTMLLFTVAWGQSLTGYQDEDDICFFPTTVGMLFAEVGVNESWGYVMFAGVITWYRKNDDGDFSPFCSELLNTLGDDDE